MNAGLEITIARENRCGHDVVFDDLLLDRRVERPGITDAGRTAVTDQVKANGVQVFLQTRAFQIFGHDTRTRRQRCFDVRRDLHPFLGRFFGHDAGRDHHRRIRRICT